MVALVVVVSLSRFVTLLFVRRPGLVVVASSRCSRCMSVGRPQILGLRLAAIARRYSRSVRHHRILVRVAPNSVSRARPLPSVNAHL